jgi:antitoxin (DNA-binding transcriptional repressor) of toxin-antitoxin stability system
MKQVSIRELHLRSLAIVHEVQKRRTPVLITERGRTVAKIILVAASTRSVFGCMAGTAKIVGDVESPVW